MAYSITIGGIGLNLTRFQERAPEFRGEVVRAFDNRLMDGTDNPKRTWDGETDWLLPATETALRAVISAGPVVCTGLVLLGETVTAKVSVESSNRGPDVSGARTDWSAVNVALSLLLREV